MLSGIILKKIGYIFNEKQLDDIMTRVKEAARFTARIYPITDIDARLLKE